MGLTFLLCRVVVIALGHLRTSALGQLQFEADCMYFFFKMLFSMARLQALHSLLLK